MTTEKTTGLARTFASIRENFPGKNNEGLRAELRRQAENGQITGHGIAISPMGRASLDEVKRVFNEETA